MKRSSRVVKPSGRFSTEDDSEESSDSVPRKKCEVAGCPCVVPICFARSSAGCAGNGWTSRWYHISMGEHYCNECFDHFYRSHKEGYAQFARWKLQWSSKSRLAPSVRGYFCSQILAFWAQCQGQGCGKWRQLSRDLDLTPEFIETFQCGTIVRQQRPSKRATEDPCSFPEDERVQCALGPCWLSLCRYTPYLQDCVAGQFLTAYYPDGVGLSPTDTHRKTKDKLSPYQQPFPVNINHPLHAHGFTPDMMTSSEIEAFPHLAQEAPYLYLGLRNLILVLWSLNPKEWLTKELVQRVVMCRGLARVCSIELLPLILQYLTQTQVINAGLVSPPKQLLSALKNTQDSVLVLGAGVSGLATAHTLSSHGYQVTVLEARDCIGGRLGGLNPDLSNAYVIPGVINNPLALLATQTEVLLQCVKGSCQLMTGHGKVVDAKTDRRIEFHYNAILDIVADWRKGRGGDDDVCLADKFKEFHEEFIRESRQYFNDGVFSQEEERVLQFHLCNLEFTCGCSMNRLSSLHWDHNESLPQFAGDHVVFPEGLGSILDKLAEGLDVRLCQKVSRVVYAGGGNGGGGGDGGGGSSGDGDGVLVQTDSGEEFKADKLVLTLPLGVLKSNKIQFQPDLPPAKQQAIQAMGSSQVEMVALGFADTFWAKSCPSHRMFGRVPSDDSQHGVFNIFQGISTIKTDGSSSHQLVSYIVGDKVEIILSKPDTEIVSLLLDTLRQMFVNKTIPDPSWSHVTRWSSDLFAGTSYSFLPVGCDGSVYDVMAQDVNNQIFFAGEATCRQFPQTVTGAYISGVREAWKIIQWQ